MTLDEYMATRPHGDLEATRLVQIIRELEGEVRSLGVKNEILEGAYNTACRHRDEYKELTEKYYAVNQTITNQLDEALQGYEEAVKLATTLKHENLAYKLEAENAAMKTGGQV